MEMGIDVHMSAVDYTVVVVLVAALVLVVSKAVCLLEAAAAEIEVKAKPVAKVDQAE